MQKLTFRSIGKILEESARRRLLLLAVARIAANLLDLIGLAGIALLATAFGSLASGSASRTTISLPMFGEWRVDERTAILIASIIVLVFLLKSGFSLWLNVRTSLSVADIEGELTRKIAQSFFGANSQRATGVSSISDFQNTVLFSTSAIAAYLNARITFIAEVSLVTAMLISFMAINPIATLAMVIMLGSALLLLNKVINSKIVSFGKIAISGNRDGLQASRDFFGSRREILSAGLSDDWLARVANAKLMSARASAVIYTLNSLPRYVIETTLILAIFAFIGGVVVFSDLQSQATTVGVFLAGGLRLVATLLPIQSALTSMKDSSNRGQPAFEAILESSPASHEQAVKLNISLNEAAVQFERVAYRYPNDDLEALVDVTLTIEPNTKVAIVGKSGAGKSTLFDLATGFLVPTSGKVTLFGANPRGVLEHKPGLVGIVPQRSNLIKGTLVDNVGLLGTPVPDQVRVKEVITQAGLGHLIGDTDWATRVYDPDQSSLSGGEIQRLGLARALYLQPKILFLDEATSALDAETEAFITQILDGLRRNITVVLIAHRLSTVISADKVIYLENGRVAAQGTFDEVVRQVPDFSRAAQLLGLKPRD